MKALHEDYVDRSTWRDSYLEEKHGLPDAEASTLMDEMRATGVRWLNMRKNVTKGTYAFNAFQQWLLPAGYRAPKGTYRKFGGTPT